MLKQKSVDIREKTKFIESCYALNQLHYELCNIYTQKGGNLHADDMESFKKSVIQLELGGRPKISDTYQKELQKRMSVKTLLDTSSDFGNPAIPTVKEGYAYLIRAMTENKVVVTSELIRQHDIQKLQKLLTTAVTQDLTDMDDVGEYVGKPLKSRLMNESSRVRYNMNESGNACNLYMSLHPDIKDKWLRLQVTVHNVIKEFCQPPIAVTIQATNELQNILQQLNEKGSDLNFTQARDHILHCTKATDTQEDVICWNIVKQLYDATFYDMP